MNSRPLRAVELFELYSGSPSIACVRFVGCVLVLLVGQIGCRERQPIEPIESGDPKAEATSKVELSFDRQLAAVRAGGSDEIRLEHQVVGTEQLSQLNTVLKLRALVLDAGIVRDSDVPMLAGLKQLEHLRLRDSPLSDVGLKQLAECRLDALLILNLPQARPTSVGLRELARLPLVRSLRIAGRQIDDAAIVELSKWPALTSLHLIQPGITDASLGTLASMPELSSLYIDECPLSDAAWEALFKARPKLHVHIDQAHHDLDPHDHQ